jgi:hypothetical protein
MVFCRASDMLSKRAWQEDDMSLPVRAELADTPSPRDFRHHWVRRLLESVADGRSPSFAYELQESPQTLRQGLEEYYAGDPNLLEPADVSNEIAQGLRAHDAAHVVFGCDTSVRGEVMLARWSLLGSREGISIYARGLRSKETRHLFGDFFKQLRPLILLLAVIDGTRAFVRSLRMQKQWPTLDWERYADRSLTQIRGDFGIQIV